MICPILALSEPSLIDVPHLGASCSHFLRLGFDCLVLARCTKSYQDIPSLPHVQVAVVLAFCGCALRECSWSVWSLLENVAKVVNTVNLCRIMPVLWVQFISCSCQIAHPVSGFDRWHDINPQSWQLVLCPWWLGQYMRFCRQLAGLHRPPCDRRLRRFNVHDSHMAPEALQRRGVGHCPQP